MKERGILFSAPMVRAILAGTKTQTRRIIDVDKLRVRLPEAVRSDLWDEMPADTRRRAAPGVRRAEVNPQFAVSAKLPDGRALGLRPGEFDFVCPYADCVTRHRNGGWRLDPIGEQRLWVRETWRPRVLHTHGADACDCGDFAVRYAADGAEIEFWEHDKRVPEDWLFPKAAKTGNVSPLFLPRWAARLVLELTEVRIERLQDISEDDARAEGVTTEPQQGTVNGEPATLYPMTHRQAFAWLWDSINFDRAPWASNPWVWVISFKRIESATRAA